MKRLFSLLAIIILVAAFPLNVFAQNKAVTISSATASTEAVAVSGSSEAVAVLVQVRDASDNILIMQSFGTVDGKFSGEITGLTLTDGTKYKVFVADYEGGDWTTAEVTATKGASTTTTTTTNTVAIANTAGVAVKAPKTGDANHMKLWSAILVLGIVIIGSTTYYYKEVK